MTPRRVYRPPLSMSRSPPKRQYTQMLIQVPPHPAALVA